MFSKIIIRCKNEIAKIIAIEDKPHSIALGVAIGILFGITPLFGIKMPLAAALSFVLRGNIIATLIIVGLADILVPFMAVIYYAEYRIGCLLFALKSHYGSADLLDDRGMVPHWIELVQKGLPLLTGSIITGVLAAIPAYFIVRAILKRRKKRI